MPKPGIHRASSDRCVRLKNCNSSTPLPVNCSGVTHFKKLTCTLRNTRLIRLFRRQRQGDTASRMSRPPLHKWICCPSRHSPDCNLAEGNRTSAPFDGGVLSYPHQGIFQQRLDAAGDRLCSCPWRKDHLVQDGRGPHWLHLKTQALPRLNRSAEDIAKEVYALLAADQNTADRLADASAKAKSDASSDIPF